MEDLSQFIALLGLNITTITSVSLWVLFVVSFLKERYPSLKDNWTLLVSFSISVGTFVAIMIKTASFDIINLIFSSAICTLLSAGGKSLLTELIRKLTNGQK